MLVPGLVVIGILVGTISALLGLGGGILLVPALTTLFHLPIRTAVGTSLVGIIATSAGVAVAAPRNRSGDTGLAFRLEVATTAGAIVGSILAGIVSERLIETLFAVVALFTAVYIPLKARHKNNLNTGKTEDLFTANYHATHWPIGLSMTVIAGAFSGLLGVSGGFIKVPVMYSIMEVPLGIATATSSIMVGITAAASVFIYYIRGDIHPFVTVPIALGIFIGAMLGVNLLPHVKATLLRTAMAGLLLLLSVQMLAKAMGA